MIVQWTIISRALVNQEQPLVHVRRTVPMTCGKLVSTGSFDGYTNNLNTIGQAVLVRRYRDGAYDVYRFTCARAETPHS